MSIRCWACEKEFLPTKGVQVSKHLCSDCMVFFKDMKFFVSASGVWHFTPPCQLSAEDDRIFQEVKRRVPTYFDERLQLPSQIAFDLSFLVALVEKMQLVANEDENWKSIDDVFTTLDTSE